MKRILTILMPAILLMSVSSCKDEEFKPSVNGQWVKQLESSNNLPVQIAFHIDGLFDWVPLTPNGSHTHTSAKYSYKDGVLTLRNDADCPGEGKYSVTFQGLTMTLTLINDGCEPRINGIVGTWTRKDLMIDTKFKKVWSKNLTIADTVRLVYFVPGNLGVFDWYIDKPTPLLQTGEGRFAVGENYFIVFGFLDCANIGGYYSYQIQDENRLIVSSAVDNCGFRTAAFTGNWNLESGL